MLCILNLQSASAGQINRLSSFSQFHTTASNKQATDDEPFGRLSRFKQAKNSDDSRTGERIGRVLAQMANYKQFKTTNEKEELWWIYSNILM